MLQLSLSQNPATLSLAQWLQANKRPTAAASAPSAALDGSSALAGVASTLAGHGSAAPSATVGSADAKYRTLGARGPRPAPHVQAVASDVRGVIPETQRKPAGPFGIGSGGISTRVWQQSGPSTERPSVSFHTPQQTTLPPQLKRTSTNSTGRPRNTRTTESFHSSNKRKCRFVDDAALSDGDSADGPTADQDDADHAFAAHLSDGDLSEAASDADDAEDAAAFEVLFDVLRLQNAKLDAILAALGTKLPVSTATPLPSPLLGPSTVAPGSMQLGSETQPPSVSSLTSHLSATSVSGLASSGAMALSLPTTTAPTPLTPMDSTLSAGTPASASAKSGASSTLPM